MMPSSRLIPFRHPNATPLRGRPIGTAFRPRAATTSRIRVPELLKPKRNALPVVMMFTGRRGKGKTLSMTATAYAQKLRYLKLGAPYTILSNYWMEFADYLSPNIIGWLNSYPDEARNMFVCIDEVQTQFPGRRSLARMNVDFSNFLTQIRKRNIEIDFTTQFPQVIDLQVLMQVELFVECDAWPGANRVDLYFHDWWGLWTGRTHKKPWPPVAGTHDWAWTIHGTDKLFDKFITEQVVPPAWAENKDQIIISEWGQEWGRKFGIGQEEEEEVERLEPAKSLEELLDRQPNVFNVMTLLDDAKKMEPTIQSKQQLKDWLQKHNCKVVTRDRVTFAEKIVDEPMAAVAS